MMIVFIQENANGMNECNEGNNVYNAFEVHSWSTL